MNEIVAAKEIFTQMIDNENVQEFCREAGVLSKLHHPNVVQFFGVRKNSGLKLQYIEPYWKPCTHYWERLTHFTLFFISLGLHSPRQFVHCHGILFVQFERGD